MSAPSNLKYSTDHEWVLFDGDVATIGITQFAADQLGDIVYLDLPKVGTEIKAGTIVGEIESTKSVGELYTPADGEVVEVNQDAVDAPDTLNNDPYEAGWLIKVKLSDPSQLDSLLDEASYNAHIGA
jgi:glycine cleavage system H protein